MSPPIVPPDISGARAGHRLPVSIARHAHPLAIAALVFSAVGASSPATARPTPRPGPAPPFTLPARAGTVSLAALRGKVVLVDFWASWCEPCRKSFPWMALMNERYGPKGLAIVAINLDKSREPAAAFLAEHPARFEIAFDPAGEVAEAFKVRAMPTSFLIAPDGTILRSHAGFDPRKAQALETLIRETCER